MSTEIGTLVAVFSADHRKFDAGIAHVERKIGGVTGTLGKTTGSVSNLTNAISPANVGLTGLSSNLGAVAGISVIAAGAIGALGAGVFNLAKSTATYGGELQDLNDQTGIGVGNLSALKLAFDESGGSIDSGATALSRYLRSVSDASTGNEKLKQKFMDVGFTVDDLNKSYGDSDKAIEILVKRVGEMGNSQDRLNALQKLGVRNGQELNGAIVAMKGNLEEFRKEAERLGLVITPEQAKAADDFDDTLQLLEKQVKGMSYQIAHQYTPQISGAMHDLSGALADNKSAWTLWGEHVNYEISGVRVAASALGEFIANFRTGGFGLGPALVAAFVGGRTKNRELHGERRLAESIGAGISINDIKPRGLGDLGGGGGGGGRGGGGGSAKAMRDELEGLRNTLTSLNTEFRKYGQEIIGAGDKTEVFADQERMLSKLLELLPSKVRLTVNATTDVNKAIADALSKVPPKLREAASALVKQMNAEIIANEEKRTSIKLLKDHIEALEAEAISLQGATIMRLRYADALRNTRPRRATVPENDDSITSLGEGSYALRPRTPSVEDLLTSERPRFATIELQVAQEEMARIREQMRDLGSDLTSIFSSSIREGFAHGADDGLKHLGLGLLDLVENFFLKRLEVGLGNLLGDLGTSGGGGGGEGNILDNILGDIGRRITSALFGGGGGGGGRGGRSIPWPTGAITGAGSTHGDTTATRERVVGSRDINAQTRELNSATSQQTNALANQIQLTGQSIVQGLTPVRQGFWEGLGQAVLGGALSGVMSRITSGLGRGGEDWSNEGPRPTTAPTRPVMRYRASGGPVSAMSPYMVGEQGPELFVPQMAGNIYNKKQQGDVEALSNQIKLTGQQIVQGLTPIGGALSGLASSLTSGIGGQENWSNEGPRPTTAATRPTLIPQHRAMGGSISAMSQYVVGEEGPELFVSQTPGNIYNKSQQGGQVVNNTFNIQLPPMPQGSSVAAKKSQRQIAEQVASFVQSRLR